MKYSQRESKDAVSGTRSPFERPLTRDKGGRARFTYETRTTAGAVLQGGDNLDVLLRFLDEKRNVVVVRTADDAVVARSPELDS